MDKVYDYLYNSVRLKDNDIIVLGNSAGPDSMALCDILLNIRKKINIKIICAHVNHNLRSESKDEEKFLKSFCEEKNIFFEYMLIENYGDDNFHNEARTIRYNFFEEVVKKYNAQYLMTAHHGDDLIETILMRIVRGSSLKGYSGFKTLIDKGSYKIVRPLIFVTKKQLEDYDIKNNIKFAVDKSNFKDKYTRNRYRKTVLPFLKSEDLNVHLKFLKFSKLLQKYDEFIDRETIKNYKKCYINGKLDINVYNTFDELIKYRIICKFVDDCYQDDLMLINDSHIELIHELIDSKKPNGIVNLPNSIVVRKSYNKLEINNLIDQICDYEIEFNGYAILPNGHIIEKIDSIEINDNNICRLKYDDVTFPLYIRTRRSGDKMLLKKIDGSKKIKDIFIDSKINKEDRDKWPIVVDSLDNIIWIPGIKKSKFTKSKVEKYDIILRYK
ncbi:MAG: tRNA lysidine(34) synthetase TilS [bacterium]|nr:tRNA lysidine(34) synthetase TilS [bacterium]